MKIPARRAMTTNVCANAVPLPAKNSGANATD